MPFGRPKSNSCKSLSITSKQTNCCQSQDAGSKEATRLYITEMMKHFKNTMLSLKVEDVVENPEREEKRGVLESELAILKEGMEILIS